MRVIIYSFVLEGDEMDCCTRDVDLFTLRDDVLVAYYLWAFSKGLV
jgi:hypothetical protein